MDANAASAPPHSRPMFAIILVQKHCKEIQTDACIPTNFFSLLSWPLVNIKWFLCLKVYTELLLWCFSNLHERFGQICNFPDVFTYLNRDWFPFEVFCARICQILYKWRPSLFSTGFEGHEVDWLLPQVRLHLCWCQCLKEKFAETQKTIRFEGRSPIQSIRVSVVLTLHWGPGGAPLMGPLNKRWNSAWVNHKIMNLSNN